MGRWSRADDQPIKRRRFHDKRTDLSIPRFFIPGSTSYIVYRRYQTGTRIIDKTRMWGISQRKGFNLDRAPVVGGKIRMLEPGEEIPKGRSWWYAEVNPTSLLYDLLLVDSGSESSLPQFSLWSIRSRICECITQTIQKRAYQKRPQNLSYYRLIVARNS